MSIERCDRCEAHEDTDFVEDGIYLEGKYVCYGCATVDDMDNAHYDWMNK